MIERGGAEWLSIYEGFNGFWLFCYKECMYNLMIVGYENDKAVL